MLMKHQERTWSRLRADFSKTGLRRLYLAFQYQEGGRKKRDINVGTGNYSLGELDRAETTMDCWYSLFLRAGHQAKVSEFESEFVRERWKDIRPCFAVLWSYQAQKEHTIVCFWCFITARTAQEPACISHQYCLRRRKKEGRRYESFYAVL
jgi:hypothetical protein